MLSWLVGNAVWNMFSWRIHIAVWNMFSWLIHYAVWDMLSWLIDNAVWYVFSWLIHNVVQKYFIQNELEKCEKKTSEMTIVPIFVQSSRTFGKAMFQTN